jgi:hypothetical protein
MRNRLKYGVPALVGLGAAGAAAAQDGNPLEVLGAGGAAALGGAAGLLGARKLAGKYSPDLLKAVKEGKVAAERSLLESAVGMPESSMQQNGILGLLDRSYGILPSQEGFTRGAGKVAAAGLVPAAGVAAGLGGMAAGQLVGGVGQLMGIDPEAPGSSNTMGSRMSMQSPMLPMY